MLVESGDVAGPGVKVPQAGRTAVAKRFVAKPYMITLTLDPDVHGYDGERAYSDCMKRRVVARFVERLYKLGCLKSKHFFAGMEPHPADNENAGMPHWHVLVDTEYVPIEVLRGVGGVPAEVGGACGARSASVRVRELSQAQGPYPREGGGVRHQVRGEGRRTRPGLDSRHVGQVRRYTTSRGFFEGVDVVKPDVPDRTGPHPEWCECDRCERGREMPTSRRVCSARSSTPS